MFDVEECSGSMTGEHRTEVCGWSYGPEASKERASTAMKTAGAEIFDIDRQAPRYADTNSQSRIGSLRLLSLLVSVTEGSDVLIGCQKYSIGEKKPEQSYTQTICH